MAKVHTVPAPVGGWNVKDSLADMPEDQASILDNWFPLEGRVDIRPGYTSYATGLGGDVETLAEFISGPRTSMAQFQSPAPPLDSTLTLV